MQLLRKFIPQWVVNIYHFFVALLAVARYGYPARKLTVIGVTGTDGKTTTSTITYHILKEADKKVALISSVAAYIGDNELETGLHVTSPDPMELQRLLREIADRGFDHVVLESTSHGLDQHRLLGANVKIGVLTNITPEHMLYHKNMDHYVASKSKLFRTAEIAVLNNSDPAYEKVLSQIPKFTKVARYNLQKTKGELRKAIWEKFPEDYNRLNAIAACLVAKKLGISEKSISAAISSFPGVPGRMEKVVNKKGLNIFIDFAHTINGLKSVLTALKKQKNAGTKLIVVFGCASERDDMKRPYMAKVATEIADESVFTAEDPRNEPIEKILDQMVTGIGDAKNYHLIPERGEAISFAINELSKKGDTVVICGKGHEKSMAYNGVEYPWSDFEAVEAALKGMVKEIKRP